MERPRGRGDTHVGVPDIPIAAGSVDEALARRLQGDGPR